MPLSDLRRTTGSVILLLLGAACVASLLPWIETDTWWVRYMDFIRVQLFIAIVVLLVLWLVVARPRRTPRLVGLGVLGGPSTFRVARPLLTDRAVDP